MRGRRTDLVGKKFDRLTVLSFVGKNKSNRAVWKCICKCGTVHQATGHDLVNNKVKSCGCFRTEVLRKHGHVLGRNIVTPELRAYYGAKSRCTKDGTNFLFDSFGKFIDSLKSKDNPSGFRPTPQHSLYRLDNGSYEWGIRPGKGRDPKRARRWRIANAKRLNKQIRARYNANPEKYIATVTAWAKAHPEYVRMRTAKRKALKLGNGGSWTVEEWQTLKRQYGHRCVCCWKTEAQLLVLGRRLVPDHIIALIKGGLNHITNLQPLCHGRGGCNNRKGSRYVDYVVS